MEHEWFNFGRSRVIVTGLGVGLKQLLNDPDMKGK
jgi:hypothetical protein